jgi:hypothetical protein
MQSDRLNSPDSDTPAGLKIERTGDILTFTLDNPAEGNRVTGAMLDAMLAVLRSEVTHPSTRVLIIRAQGDVFCTGRERAGRDIGSIRQESARIFEFKRALRTTSLILPPPWSAPWSSRYLVGAPCSSSAESAPW